MQIDRRRVLSGIGALALTAQMRPAAALTRTELGDMEVLSLSDGHLVLPGSFYFDGLPEADLAAILARHQISAERIEAPCNVTVLRQGTRTVLFDAGSGSGFMPSAGALGASLDALGIAPDEVTHVVFTHGHPDHLWGVLDDFDDPVFAEAEYLFGRDEWAYWSDPDTVARIGEARAAFAVGAARRLAAIEERCTFFGAGDEILPGVLAHATTGHTPGHMSFELRAGGSGLMVVGDAIGNAHVAFERPDWGSGADQDRDTGAATRQRLLDMLAQDQMPMIGFHLPEGGMGRVERNGSAYRFAPLEG